MFPSHSAIHGPLPPAMRGRPSCSLPEGQPKPASQGQPTATLVQDYPPPSCMLTYAYSLARHRVPGLGAGGQRIRQEPGRPILFLHLHGVG